MAFSRRQIVFIHPDLGIGGAERLIVDAAVSLQTLGHKVVIFTSHCDKSHCFDEARDGTLDVRVRGDIFPRTIAGRFSIFCAIVRQLMLMLHIAFFTSELRKLEPEVFFVDQLSACIPLLRHWFPYQRILFYCHFPDKLLARRGGWIKSVYRIPFDWLEGFSTGGADLLLVNSNFTKSVFSKAFPRLSHRNPRVVQPCVDEVASQSASSTKYSCRNIILSINRYEEKKDLGLAIRAFAALSKEIKDKATLVIAGGYDRRVPENVSCHKALCLLTQSLNLTHTTIDDTDFEESLGRYNVIFLRSISNDVKHRLLQTARIVAYTPAFEHFGIVPLEAMLARTPVIAANIGGPTESIIDSETGWLRDVSEVKEWTKIFDLALDPQNTDLLSRMGDAGHERVTEKFSKTRMAQELDNAMTRAIATKSRPRMMDDGEILVTMGIILVLGLVGGLSGGIGLFKWMIHTGYLKTGPKYNG